MFVLENLYILLCLLCCVLLAFGVFYMHKNISLVKWFAIVLLEFSYSINLVLVYILKSWLNFFYAHHKDLKNEVVLLTGASGGIGKLLATKLVKKECILVLIDIDDCGLKDLADSLNKSSVQQVAYPFKCDVSNYEEVSTVKSKIVETVGHPTMIINNAGIVNGKYFLDLEPNDVQKTFNVNILSHFWIVKQFLPHMLDANHGHIISVASILGLDSMAGVSDYGASKAAAVNFMRSLRQEIRVMGKFGIHCTTVLPFLISTDMFKGITTRFKNMFLLNVLDPDFVTDRIIDAIERNQTTLYIPRILYFSIALMAVLPDFSFDVIVDFLKINLSMKTFVGKKKQ